MSPLIGIAGKARSGKDSVAAMLLELGAARYRYSFADPLRAMLNAGFGIDMTQDYWIERKEKIVEPYGKSPRQMLQTLGTQWGRDCVNADVWVQLAAEKFRALGPGMVIPDVRFENEALWIRDSGGVLIHIDRVGLPGVAAHESENGVAHNLWLDITLRNNGDMLDLRNSVVQMVEEELW